MNSHRPCVFGEVLFDHFPDGSRVLGGAPFNVAWHLQAFGQAPRFVSRVGDDDEGREIRAAMQSWGMDTATLQTDPNLPTGRVSVSFDDNEPSYDIVRPAAYDAIAPYEACGDCDLVYHGTLALRDPTSFKALSGVLDGGPSLVFVDVNLRAPWWQRERVLAMMSSANWLKINADELHTLQSGPPAGDDAVADMLDRYGLDGVVVTYGSRGAAVFTRDGERSEVAPTPGAEIVDTVGAGDAFASVVILGLIRQWPADLMLQRAQAFASRIVGNRGAVLRKIADYQPFIDAWKLAN
jgi:fructokinase